jgi:nucleotide-binding universal stress UspA family protein
MTTKEAKAMGPFKHVLVPVDFGNPTEHALDLALSIARPGEARITLVHAFDSTPFMNVSPFLPPLDVEPIVAALQKEMRALCDKVKARYGRVEGTVVRGNVFTSILDFAKTHECDLIVIGTHGRRGIAHAFLGSVAEKVVRMSPVPVLTVHP